MKQLALLLKLDSQISAEAIKRERAAGQERLVGVIDQLFRWCNLRHETIA